MYLDTFQLVKMRALSVKIVTLLHLKNRYIFLNLCRGLYQDLVLNYSASALQRFFPETGRFSQQVIRRLKTEFLLLPVNLGIKDLDIMHTKYFSPIKKRK